MPNAILATKVCTRCNQEKSLSEFRKKLDKLTAACKTCLKHAYSVYLTPEKVEEQRESNKRYHAENKAARNRKSIEWHAKNKEVASERSSAWRDKNKQHLLDYFSRYRKENLAKILDANSIYCKSKREADPLFAMRARMRCLIGNSIRNAGYSKRSKTSELLGCDWAVFKSHIESQFLTGMTWANRQEWHIDHIVPLASACSEAEVIALNHYTNLQPLWSGDNIRKGAKLDWNKYGNAKKETESCR